MDGPFSDQLECWLRSDSTKTLGALSEMFAEKSFAATIVLLMFVPALPLPTGGVSHLFELIAVVLAAQMVVGRRTIWLPDSWQRRELGGATTEKAIPFMIRWIRRVERFSRPRGALAVRAGLDAAACRSAGDGFAVGAAIAPPFSGFDTLPAMGAVAVALAIILEDMVVLEIGAVFGTGGIILIVTVGAAIARYSRAWSDLLSHTTATVLVAGRPVRRAVLTES